MDSEKRRTEYRTTGRWASDALCFGVRSADERVAVGRLAFGALKDGRHGALTGDGRDGAGMASPVCMQFGR